MTLDFATSIKDASNWDDVYIQFKRNNVGKDHSAGKLFEYFCKYYYLSEPSVKNEYKNVWLFQEIPLAIKQKLNLGKVDHGIDLVLQGLDDSLSVVQCKFRNDQNSIISWTKDNLANLFADGDKADYFVVFSNASGLDKHSLTKKVNKLKIVTLGDLLDISPSTINEMRKRVAGIKKIAVDIKIPWDYQQKAIEDVINGFKKNDRGQLILPCAAGKTLISLWIKEALKAKHTLVLVPSLALLRQVKKEWAANSLRFVSYMCVCSEKDIDKAGDQPAVHTYEIDGKVTTNPNEIHEFLNSHKESIVYSTYQSLAAICKATKKSDFKFDLAVCDEAHKTAGSKQGTFGLIHSNKNIYVNKRLYMTATPRVISENLKNKLNGEEINYLCDMANPAIFGNEFSKMSFKEAIQRNILVDYRIVAVGVSEQDLEKAIKLRRYVSDHVTIDEIANNYALEKFMEEYHPTHAITFHSSVRRAKDFQERHNHIYPNVNTYHVNGALTTNERNVLMHEFVSSTKSVMTNSRCLIEGIDVPSIDVVYFCDPKYSTIDIVQATGRALRKADHKGKKLGYVLVPIFHGREDIVEIDIDAGPFKNLMSVVRSLCSQDERLLDEIKEFKLGEGQKKARSSHTSIISSCNIITLNGFNDKLKEYLFYQVINKTRIPYRNFAEARKFVHSLRLQSWDDWRSYSTSAGRPHDIPSNPHTIYKDNGWISMGDWLGSGTIAIKDIHYRSFNNARKFVCSLKLKSGRDWRKYCSSGKKPIDIPADPRRHYKNEGWKSMGDWLGTKTIAPRNMIFRPFKEAREFVHSLELKNSDEWRNYSKSKKPTDIPVAPNITYKSEGWKSWGDWLGTGKISNRDKSFCTFEAAREFAHSLNLNGGKDWLQYCKSGKKPKDIPANPNVVYKNDGWKSMGDWLGTGNISNRDKVFRPFKDARKFVHSLGLKKNNDWRKYSMSGKRPNDIPGHPNQAYKSKGWKSWGDWLGTGKIARKDTNFRSFIEARTFIHALELNNTVAWQKYSKSGLKPNDIPLDPRKVYKNEGWSSMGDWLGTGTIAHLNMVFRPFKEARDHIRSLGLKGSDAWKKYCESGKKPKDIPASPGQTYRNKGWKSWGDWLGTGHIATQDLVFRSFEKAREFVRSLKLKSGTDWKKYCKSGNKPDDIPSHANRTYKNAGWKSMGDWLGTGNTATRDKNFRSFEDAREFVSSLKLNSSKDWAIYCKCGKKPADIPVSPGQTYKNKGWVSMGDWLGTGTIAPQNKVFRPFKDAKEFVHCLDLKSNHDWRKYTKSGLKPNDIPINPDRAYKNEGWKSWGDWLGTGKIAYKNMNYRSFIEARKFIHKLGLKNSADWRKYSNCGLKPNDIPVSPNQTYKNEGWKSWGDWLGTGNIAAKNIVYRSFDDARAYIHSLKLKSSHQWAQC